MFSGNPIILILGLISFAVFFYLLRLRASKKQIDSFEQPKRMNWSWLWLKYGKNKEKSKLLEYDRDFKISHPLLDNETKQSIKQMVNQVLNVSGF